jgi:uncharacterized membrane protein
MRVDKKIISFTVYIFLGMALLGAGVAELVDAFWSGMGGALIAVGVVRLVHYFRWQKDADYREKKEIEVTDERNRFIRNKAWACAGYLFMLAAAVSTIVFKLLRQDLLSIAAGFSICFMMILYWICYLVLNKKY